MCFQGRPHASIPVNSLTFSWFSSHVPFYWKSIPFMNCSSSFKDPSQICSLFLMKPPPASLNLPYCLNMYLRKCSDNSLNPPVLRQYVVSNPPHKILNEILSKWFLHIIYTWTYICIIWNLPVTLFFLKGVIYLFIFINLFIYFWLHWVFVAARGLFSSCGEQELLLLQSTGSRCPGSIVVARKL